MVIKIVSYKCFLWTFLINHKHLFHSGTAKKLSCFGFFNTKVQEAYNIINFSFLMENSILKTFGSMDLKITPDFCFLKIKITYCSSSFASSAALRAFSSFIVLAFPSKWLFSPSVKFLHWNFRNMMCLKKIFSAIRFHIYTHI